MLNKRIKEQRIISKRTQEEMAQLLNVQRATYGQYEIGKNQPPIDKLVILADIFGVSLDYLTCREDRNLIDVNETIRYILNNLKNSSKDLTFESKEFDTKTNELLCCSLENVLQITKIAMRD